MPKKIIKNIEFYEKKTIFIDDLAKETALVNDFGTKETPMSDMFALRYSSNALTFATSNFKIEQTIKNNYSEYISERFYDMFNILELNGKSFRKK